jgi:hypothetical protein
LPLFVCILSFWRIVNIFGAGYPTNGVRTLCFTFSASTNES